MNQSNTKLYENLGGKFTFSNLEEEFLNFKESNFDMLLEKVKLFHSYLNKDSLNPKFKTNKFSYIKELENVSIPESGKETTVVFEEASEFFQGSMRTQSPYAVFNMVPSPLMDTVAASTISQLYNTNSLMDSFGGKTILFEQKIARSIGQMVGWDNSYGISCNGGKVTLLYAVKSAISKLDPNSRRDGISNNLVVLTNESSHYCVEHVCSLLGIGSNKCIRIKSEDGWKMDTNDLINQIETEHEKGNKIAAIICAGGTTINFACDDTNKIFSTVKDYFEKNNLDYFPYFHLDSVIGWLWINFIGLSESQWAAKVNNSHIRTKIKEVVKRIQGVINFDSFGVDMHKNGLCPYSTSMFICKTKDNFNYLNDGNYEYNDSDFELGNFRAYRYTFENSRPATGIITSWIAMNRLGREGFQAYLVKLNELTEMFKSALNSKDNLKVINNSLGWEIVFSISFKSLEEASYDSHEELCKSFIKYCWNKVNEGEEVPFISIVPEYKITPKDNPKTAFLIFPMSLYLDSTLIDTIVENLCNCIKDFERKVLIGEITIRECLLEKPIR